MQTYIVFLVTLPVFVHIHIMCIYLLLKSEHFSYLHGNISYMLVLSALKYRVKYA